MSKPLKSQAKSKSSVDLFATQEPKGRSAAKAASRLSGAEAGYTAADIEVLEGLEPVRRRPGMYIGGTDEKALHHLFAEVIDNSMDEALAGHATFIEVELGADGFLTVTDNGRGIPVDPHPKFPKKSALEVIMCTLHSGGKFDSKVYETSGGLHGVGVSVVNALSSRLEVEVARSQKLYRMSFERGHPKGKIEDLGKINNRRGTKIRFKPDTEIFGAKTSFKPPGKWKLSSAGTSSIPFSREGSQCHLISTPPNRYALERAILNKRCGLKVALTPKMSLSGLKRILVPRRLLTLPRSSNLPLGWPRSNTMR